MLSLKGRVAAVLLIISLLLPVASAHVPQFPQGNDSPGTAHEIDPPEKSWVLYDELEGSQWFLLRTEEGERLMATLVVPGDDGGEGLGMALIGPGLVPEGDLPPDIAVPEGMGAIVPDAEAGEAEYEGFTPSALREVASVEMTVGEGEHYIVVYGEGSFALVVGEVEAFTPAEYLSIPHDVIRIHLWEGIPLALLLAPFLLMPVATLLIAPRWVEVKGRRWLSLAAGGAFLATAASLAMNMAIALAVTGLETGVAITLVLIAASVALGTWAVRLSGREIDGRWRATMALVSLLALVAWSGLHIGPVLALAAALWPSVGDGDHHLLPGQTPGEEVGAEEQQG